MAAMWSWIFFLSFFGTLHFLHCSEASSIRRLVNSDRGVVALFLRLNHCECHPLDVESYMYGYSSTRLFQSWMPKHPISMCSSCLPLFSLFFWRVTVKKYIHKSKWADP